MATEEHKGIVQVAFVGATQTGKSALIERLTHDEFSPPYAPTLGFQVASKRQDSEGLQIDLWDFSGEARYEELIPSLVAQASIIVYTLNAAENAQPLQEQIDYLRRLRTKGLAALDVISIVVVTQDDLPEEKGAGDLIQGFREQDLQIEQESLVCVVSAKTGSGIEAFDQLLFKSAAFIRANQTNQPYSRQEIEAFFWAAKEMVLDLEKPANTHPSTSPRMEMVRKKLYALERQTLADLDQNKFTPKEAYQIATSAYVLSCQVAHLENNLEKAIEGFHTAVRPCIKTSLLGKVIGGLIGAVLGVAVGALLGSWSGFGAAWAALYAGSQGAALGAVLGGSVGGLAGAWFSLWYQGKMTPLMELERAAYVVAQHQPR